MLSAIICPRCLCNEALFTNPVLDYKGWPRVAKHMAYHLPCGTQ